MSGQLLVNELNEYSTELSSGVRLMAKYGKEYAAAESDYKIALMQESLKLRDAGMAVTLIDKVVYGKCAEQRLKRDIAEVMYKSAQENVNSIKLQMRLLDAQISREWGCN
ncbi:hypothetical protein M2140_001951 [Clostridiales Family XIII bacterium PM5-7]